MRAPAVYRERYNLNFDTAWTREVSSNDILTHYHTHWDENNILVRYDALGNPVHTADGPSSMDYAFVQNTSHLVSNAMLIDRYSLYYYNMYRVTNNWGTTFFRYFPFYLWYK